MATGSALPARTGFHVTGTLTATETERTEGYFNLSKDTMIAVRPHSYQYDILSSMLNQDVQLSIFKP